MVTRYTVAPQTGEVSSEKIDSRSLRAAMKIEENVVQKTQLNDGSPITDARVKEYRGNHSHPPLNPLAIGAMPWTRLRERGLRV